MKIFITALLIVALTGALASDYVVTHSLYRQIKETAQTWTPVAPEQNKFRGWTREQVRRILGLRRNHKRVVNRAPIVNETNDEFDARKQWPGDIHKIRDQARCGSCWAFAASEALSDSFAIHSNGKVNVVLSPQDEVSCDSGNMGCQGGYLDRAWDYLESTGIVTDSCFPYSSGGGSVEHCLHGTCKDSHVPYIKYKCQEGQVHSASGSAIKALIKKHGPVETGFTVYSDFMQYSGGIYKHTSGFIEGGHAVKIVGWGNENGTNYWICANSWGPAWGESGFFRIAFNQCGIDDEVFTCTPDTTHLIGHRH